jgi:hypothetical protein
MNIYKNINTTLKKQSVEYIVIVLMLFFIISDYKVPKNLSKFVDTFIGRLVIILFCISMLFVHNVLGVVSIIFAYELLRRSEKSTGSYQLRHYVPSETIKNGHLTAMQQFPITLEEQMINNLVPLVKNAPSVNSNYKPVMDNLHGAAIL